MCSGVLYGGSGEVRGDDAELKWQGVLGSVLKTTTKDPGGRRLFCWLGEGSLVRGRLVCVGRDKFRFRFFFFLYFPSNVQNYPSPFVCVKGYYL